MLSGHPPAPRNRTTTTITAAPDKPPPATAFFRLLLFKQLEGNRATTSGHNNNRPFRPILQQRHRQQRTPRIGQQFKLIITILDFIIIFSSISAPLPLTTPFIPFLFMPTGQTSLTKFIRSTVPLPFLFNFFSTSDRHHQSPDIHQSTPPLSRTYRHPDRYRYFTLPTTSRWHWNLAQFCLFRSATAVISTTATGIHHHRHGVRAAIPFAPRPPACCHRISYSLSSAFSPPLLTTVIIAKHYHHHRPPTTISIPIINHYGRIHPSSYRRQPLIAHRYLTIFNSEYQFDHRLFGASFYSYCSTTFADYLISLYATINYCINNIQVKYFQLI